MPDANLDSRAWEAVIGLEVHARLLTSTKLFCGCPTAFGAPPNHQVCPVCLGYPGMLPVLNRRAVDLAVRMAVATGCDVASESGFARKNYFYPDLPKGYQITQHDPPLATGGSIAGVGLRRIHLEEDAGKLIHGSEASLVDLNRAGTPLIEIVSEPEIRSAAGAVQYLTRLRQIVMYAGVCDGNMEEGSLRCDANVSVRRMGEPLGTRTEVKNLNSFRYVGRAIEYEVERQIALLEAGEPVIQETRLFDVASGETRRMRSKEEAHDYRYLPEPDLGALLIDAQVIEEAKAALPPMPDARIARYVSKFGLSESDAEVLVASREVADYFEAVAAEADPRAAANWVRNDVLRVLNESGVAIAEFRVRPAALAALLRLLAGGTIGGKAAKEVFESMAATGESAEAVVERLGLRQVSDAGAIREAAETVLARHPEQVAEYRAGRTKIFGFLVGQLMKEMRGKANAEMANAAIRALLDE